MVAPRSTTEWERLVENSQKRSEARRYHASRAEERRLLPRRARDLIYIVAGAILLVVSAYVFILLAAIVASHQGS